MARQLCNGVFWVFAVLYLAATVLLLIGTFGWFGQARDPLSGVFLIPLGLPWNLFLDGLAEPLRLWAAVAAPLLNVALIRVVCGRLST